MTHQTTPKAPYPMGLSGLNGILGRGRWRGRRSGGVIVRRGWLGRSRCRRRRGEDRLPRVGPRCPAAACRPRPTPLHQRHGHAHGHPRVPAGPNYCHQKRSSFLRGHPPAQSSPGAPPPATATVTATTPYCFRESGTRHSLPKSVFYFRTFPAHSYTFLETHYLLLSFPARHGTRTSHWHTTRPSPTFFFPLLFPVL